VTSALAGLDIIEVAKAGIPFIILLIGLLFLISYVPSISLFLPNLVGL
jgi:C4-dicarboxylate transporter DctM subunit